MAVNGRRRLSWMYEVRGLSLFTDEVQRSRRMGTVPIGEVDYGRNQVAADG